MREADKNAPAYATLWLAALLTLLALPLVIGAAALFEEKVIGTFYVAEACRAVGIFGPLRQLARLFGAP